MLRMQLKLNIIKELSIGNQNMKKLQMHHQNQKRVLKKKMKEF